MQDKRKAWLVFMRFDTALLHGNMQSEGRTGATVTPIYQSSAFEHESAEKLEKIFHNQAAGFAYTRIDNPTVEVFEQRITRLEGGISTVACASGMAAIFNAVMNVVRSGDELIASATLYGGTIDLFRDLESYGIVTKYVTEISPETVAEQITEKTKLIFAETIGNPKLNVLDIRAIASLAHEKGILFIVDNTVATPYLCRPLELGADVVIESSSKYINGNGNSISGVIVDGGKFKWDTEKYPDMKPYVKMGPFAYTAKLRNALFRDTGACLAPMNAFLNNVGLETLGLRMERACYNAKRLAEWMKESGLVDAVSYPGLPDSPSYQLAESQFGGKGYGAMVTIRVGSKERAFQVINSLKYALKVSNIGDSKTLVIHPDSTLFCHSNEEEKLAAGVYCDMIRISVGIEDIEDLIEDFEQALKM